MEHSGKEALDHLKQMRTPFTASLRPSILTPSPTGTLYEGRQGCGCCNKVPGVTGWVRKASGDEVATGRGG